MGLDEEAALVTDNILASGSPNTFLHVEQLISAGIVTARTVALKPIASLENVKNK